MGITWQDGFRDVGPGCIPDTRGTDAALMCWFTPDIGEAFTIPGRTMSATAKCLPVRWHDVVYSSTVVL